ncbi:alpha,alpha-trehalase [Anaerolineae bacterium CFX9]|nr:alpha,alpha-trehalase [Anaerolineae bacterium CFX9]
MAYDSVLHYIDGFWPKLLRSNPADKETLIGLPHPYFVPAPTDGRMFQEMYYWDSYFIALGLVDTPYAEHIVGMAENMAYLFDRFGIIPNGSRYYFLSRSQPPFFMALVKLAYDTVRHDDAWLAKMLDVAVREHHKVWLGTQQPHFRQVYRGLSRYYDINALDILASCECGWDHSTRCDDRWLDHVPVDLNCILYDREMDYATFYELLGSKDEAAAWRAKAEERRQTIQELMWSEADGYYFDYDYKHQHQTPSASLAGFFALWAGAATPEQAARMVKHWLPKFEYPGGLVTTLESKAGRQWAFPNGWAPLQWIVTEGLDRYGFSEHARRIRRAWCDNVAQVFEQTGRLWEKYNVVEPFREAEEGLYGQVPGFGWTNAIFVDFTKKLAS